MQYNILLLAIAANFFANIFPVFAQEKAFPEKSISNQADSARSVYAVDLDGDGDQDVLSASMRDNKIAWYKNNGNGTFGEQQIISTDAKQAYSVYAGDLDGDQIPDVLSASFLDNKIAWYKNNGNGTFGGQQIISENTLGAISVHAADLDGDGDQDVLSASYNDDKIVWYKNNGHGNFHGDTISTDADGARSVYAADLDGDKIPDVLSASGDRGKGKVAWYNNNDGTFNAHPISTQLEATSVHAADLDGDGDQDVLSASGLGNQLFWYNNTNGNGTFGEQQIISENLLGAISVHAADLDGDGDQDVLSASGNDDKIAWYKNNGRGIFGEQQIISTDADGARSVYAADLDGDGDQDVLSASQLDDKIAWYENNIFLRVPTVKPATQIESEQFTANWSAVKDAAGYKLYVAKDPEFNQPQSGYNGIEVVNGTSLPITELEPNQTYYYRVRSINLLEDSSAYSGVQPVETKYLPITNFAAQDITDSSFVVSWNKLDEAQNYFIYVATDNKFEKPVAGYNPKTVDTPVTVTVPNQNTTYYCRVEAVAVDERVIGISDVLEVKTMKSEVPAPVAQAATDITSSGFTANWQAVSGVISYKIDVAKDISFNPILNTYTSTETFLTITGLETDQTYFYRIRAVKDDTESAHSNTIEVTTLPPQPIVYDDTLEAVVGQTILLKGENLGTDKSKIKVTIGNEDAEVISLKNDGKEVTLKVPEVLTLQENPYPVVVNVGIQKANGEVWVKVVDNEQPIFTNISVESAEPGASIILFGANLGDQKEDITVELNTIPATEAILAPVDSIKSESGGSEVYLTLPSDLEPKTYTITLQLKDNTVGEKTLKVIPPAPVAQAATDITSSGFTANWQAVSGVISYKIDVAKDISFNPILNTYTSTETFLTITGLETDQTYFYRIRAVKDDTESAHSNTISVMTRPQSTDSEAPIIIPLSLPPNHIFGLEEALVLSVTATDAGSGIDTFTLTVAGLTGDLNSGKHIKIQEDGENTYQATLSASDDLSGILDDSLGIQYAFTFTDSAGNIATATGRTYWEFPSDAINPHWFSVGNKDADGLTSQDYNIIALPFEPQQVISVLEELGSYDDKKWRLYGYNASSQSFEEFTQPNVNTIEASKGYMLIMRKDMVQFGGKIAPMNEGNYHEIVLSEGYNLIGNPFPFAIDWQIIQEYNADLILGNLIRLTGSPRSYSDGQELNAYEGAFLWYNEQSPATLRIPITSQLNNARITRTSGKHYGWQLPLVLESKGLVNRIGGIGMRTDARNGWDQYDVVRLPQISAYIEPLIQAEGIEIAMNRSVVPEAEQYVWNLEIAGSKPEAEVTMSWSAEEVQALTYDLYLIDEPLGRVIAMHQEEKYRFLMPTDGTKPLKIYYGNPQNLTEAVPVIQVNVGLPFPNPVSQDSEVIIPLALPHGEGAYQVHIEWYNQYGQKVSSFTDEVVQSGYQLLHPLTDMTNWPAGLYTGRLTIQNEGKIYNEMIRLVVN